MNVVMKKITTHNSKIKIMRNFYCQKKCGDVNFSIEEWNKAFKFCNDAGIEGVERDKILNPELFPCEVQCNDCINIVLETQKKNKLNRFAEILLKQSNNEIIVHLLSNNSNKWLSGFLYDKDKKEIESITSKKYKIKINEIFY